MRYINWRSESGLETIDQIDPKDFNTYQLFRKELRSVFRSYKEMGMNIYISQRSCRDW